MSKRGTGEGSCRRRPDGRWEATSARKESIDGKRHSEYGKTQREALDKLKAWREENADGRAATDRSSTVADWLEWWLENWVRMKNKPPTYAGYKATVDKHLVPVLGRVKLADLRAEHITHLHATLLDKGLSPAMVAKCHDTLGSALSKAVHPYGKISFNPASKVTPPLNERPPVVAYTPEQVAAILDAAEGEPLAALFVLAVETGLRCGELRALDWCHLDLAGDLPALRVEGTATELSVDGHLVVGVGTPKSRSGYRKVGLSKRAVAALRAHRLASADSGLGGPVFVDQKGNRLRASSVTRAWYRIRDRAGVPAHKFHTLRNSYATRLVDLGIPIKHTSVTMGHANTTITNQYYVSVTDENLAAVTAALDAEAAALRTEAGAV